MDDLSQLTQAELWDAYSKALLEQQQMMDRAQTLADELYALNTQKKKLDLHVEVLSDLLRKKALSQASGPNM